MRRVALAAILALGLSAPAFAQKIITFDRGGLISDTLTEITAQSGQRVVIAGDCMSACTMWLGHAGTCVMPGATLYFHAAQDGLRAMHDPNPWRTISASGNATLRGFYPPGIRSYVDRNGWLNTPELHSMSGAQAISLGARACR